MSKAFVNTLVGISQYGYSPLGENIISFYISVFVFDGIMLYTVDLYHDLFLRNIEIHNIIINIVLTLYRAR